MSENEPEEKSTAYWPTGFSTVLKMNWGGRKRIFEEQLCMKIYCGSCFLYYIVWILIRIN
jgi:hypothetical protein